MEGAPLLKKVFRWVPGFLFPVGDSASSVYSYKPAISNDSSISTVDTFAVKVAHGLLPTTGADPTCVQYTWFVQEDNPNSSKDHYRLDGIQPMKAIIFSRLLHICGV